MTVFAFPTPAHQRLLPATTPVPKGPVMEFSQRWECLRNGFTGTLLERIASKWPPPGMPVYQKTVPSFLPNLFPRKTREEDPTIVYLKERIHDSDKAADLAGTVRSLVSLAAQRLVHFETEYNLGEVSVEEAMSTIQTLADTMKRTGQALNAYAREVEDTHGCSSVPLGRAMKERVVKETLFTSASPVTVTDDQTGERAQLPAGAVQLPEKTDAEPEVAE